MYLYQNAHDCANTYSYALWTCRCGLTENLQSCCLCWHRLHSCTPISLSFSQCLSLIGTCCPNLYKWRQGNCCWPKERKGGRTFLDNEKLSNNSFWHLLLFYLVIDLHCCTFKFPRLPTAPKKEKGHLLKIFGPEAEFCHLMQLWEIDRKTRQGLSSKLLMLLLFVNGGTAMLSKKDCWTYMNLYSFHTNLEKPR